MPAKYCHVSLYSRFHQDEFRGGGVEKFAHLLQLAIPELEIFSWLDCPVQTKQKEHWEMAEILNDWLLQTGRIDDNSIVIGDGFWVAGLPGKVARVISVCHGSYWGTAIEHEKFPWGDGWIGDWAFVQEELWNDERVEVVTVSKQSARELESICGITSDITIHHGIPLNIYKPMGNNRNENLILHVASRGRKNLELVGDIMQRKVYQIDRLGYPSDGTLESESALWNRGRFFLSPTRYEGNSYALLEAMACDLIPITYATGYACELSCEAAWVTDDNDEVSFLIGIEEVMENRDQYFPRVWAEENLSFDSFSEKWRKYLAI